MLQLGFLRRRASSLLILTCSLFGCAVCPCTHDPESDSTIIHFETDVRLVLGESGDLNRFEVVRVLDPDHRADPTTPAIFRSASTAYEQLRPLMAELGISMHLLVAETTPVRAGRAFVRLPLHDANSPLYPDRTRVDRSVWFEVTVDEYGEIAFVGNQLLDNAPSLSFQGCPLDPAAEAVDVPALRPGETLILVFDAMVIYGRPTEFFSIGTHGGPLLPEVDGIIVVSLTSGVDRLFPALRIAD